MSRTAALTRASPKPLELADVLARFASSAAPLTASHGRVVGDIIACRTHALGGHIQQCDQCGHLEPFFNSCRNRHCPKCQCLSQARWLEARQRDLLPVEYFHVVFTIPNVLHQIFRGDPKTAYGLLFAAVAETLRETAMNPKLLGARIGFTAVLHTWTQTLLYHPHVHCVVPGGGISLDGTKWVACKRGFFLPVKAVLSKVFRGKLLGKLETALNKKAIRLIPSNASSLLKQAARKNWHVFAKRPFAGPQQVLSYLGQYTHRIAISNSRVVSMSDTTVTLRYQDRADGNKKKLMTLPGESFVRRFLYHVMPQGFHRIRHYGFLANSNRKASVSLCRLLLAVEEPRDPQQPDDKAEAWHELLLRLTGIDVLRCPRCGTGSMAFKHCLPEPPRRWLHHGSATSI